MTLHSGASEDRSPSRGSARHGCAPSPQVPHRCSRPARKQTFSCLLLLLPARRSKAAHHHHAGGGVLHTSDFQVSPEEDRQARAAVKADVAAGTTDAFAALARFGIRAAHSMQDTPQHLGGGGGLSVQVPHGGGGGGGGAPGSPGDWESSGGELDSPDAAGSPSSGTGHAAARTRWIRGTSKVPTLTPCRHGEGPPSDGHAARC